MKTRLTFLLIVTFFSGIVIGQDCSFYYPELAGAKLVYKNYDGKDKYTGKNAQEVITYNKTATGAEATINVKSYDEKDKMVGESTFEVSCKDGVFYMDMKNFISPETMAAYKDMQLTIDSKNLEFPSRLKVGDKLNDGSVTMDVSTGGFKIMTISVLITERVVEAEETITTPAGSFKCYKISQTVTSKVGMKVVTKSYDWISPTVGTVKSEAYTSEGKLSSRRELTELSR